MVPCGGSPTLRRGGGNQKWPTSGRIGDITGAVWGVCNAAEMHIKSEVAHKWGGGYITPTVSGVPNASELWTKSEVAHKWADWLHQLPPCLLNRQFAHLWANSDFVPRFEVLGTPPGCRGHVANPPTSVHFSFCPPLWSVGDVLGNRGYVANPPTCGPLLICSPL